VLDLMHAGPGGRRGQASQAAAGGGRGRGLVRCVCLGTGYLLARAIYIRCKHGIFGREVAKYTVIYDVYT